MAGGRGIRMENETQYIPKPMVRIGDMPIIWHIMKLFAYYGHTEFFILTGYRGTEFSKLFSLIEPDWNVNLVDTGLDTLTGNRILQIRDHLKEKFFLTYGDGLGDINLLNLLENHKYYKQLVTVTAVHPHGRFGALELSPGGRVIRFAEKEPLATAWINGGFFVIEPKALEYIKGEVMWEHAPLEKLAEDCLLWAYKHNGFWYPMDTPRDKEYLEEMWKKEDCPWRIWNGTN